MAKKLVTAFKTSSFPFLFFSFDGDASAPTGVMTVLENHKHDK